MYCNTIDTLYQLVDHGCSVDLWRSHSLCRSIVRCQGFLWKGKRERKQSVLNLRNRELN